MEKVVIDPFLPRVKVVSRMNGSHYEDPNGDIDDDLEVCTCNLYFCFFS